MKLKEYQNDTLFVLKRFLEEARLAGPKNAYEAITREPEQAGRLGQYASAYAPLTRLPNVPYVCLRLPTGGGKTILGAYAIRVARDAWIEKDYPPCPVARADQDHPTADGRSSEEPASSLSQSTGRGLFRTS